MNQLSQDFKGHLLQAGADLVGFADLSCLPKLPDAPGCHIGVSVCVSIPAQIIRSIADGPNLAYFQAYHTLNAKLDALVCEAADWLQQQGYRAWAQSEEHVHETEDYRTPLPHKTVAVLAGLGWIGKSALFVSKEYGSAVRLSSLVTDAPLSCGEPVRSSRCGSCMVCRDACALARQFPVICGSQTFFGINFSILMPAAKLHASVQRSTFTKKLHCAENAYRYVPTHRLI